MDSNEGAEVTATRFGNFEVLKNPEGGLHLLGGGGFGKTYKARHVYLNQIVALKVINDRLLHDNSAKERFLREAQVVNQLRHPHIAHVLDFGEVKNSLYYAMEFCGGGNLEHMVNRVGPLSLPVLLSCARQLAAALGCAHQHGFIHRDVKPANIMLTSVNDEAPDLKLVDFGLVKNLQQGGSEATAALTMTGQQFFTIQFASPEQLMEEELDARSDLFALGMTLWFLLKGSPPETGSMASIVAKRLDQKSYELQLPPGLPAAYRSVLARLLEKDRGQRFQDTNELLAALAVAEAAPDAVAAESSMVTESEPKPDPKQEPKTEPEPTDSHSITAFYDVHENLGSTALGVAYRATRNRDSEPVTFTLISDAVREDGTQRALLESNVARLKDQPHESLVRVFGLEEYEEGLALVQEWQHGVSLHDILKNARFLAYSEALRVLAPIAQGTDWTTVQGLPGTMLGMNQISLQPLDAAAYPEPEKLLETPLKDWPPFRVRLLPYIIREEGKADVSETISTEIFTEPTVAFGWLLYNLVAGHAPKNLAKLNKSGYVTIGRLAEDSNRLLASCIVNERDFGGCEGVLRALNTSEGVSFGGTQRPPDHHQYFDGVDQDGKKFGGRMGPGGLEVWKEKPAGPTQRLPETNRVDLTKSGKTDTGGRKGGIVIETRTINRPGLPGTTTGKANRDLARQTEEVRLKKEAEDAQLRQKAEEDTLLRQQADEEARARKQEEDALNRKQAEAARLRKQTEDARLKKEADEIRLRKQTEDARLKKEADEIRLRKQAEDARLKREAEEARLRKREEDALLKKQAEEARVWKQTEEARLKQQAKEAQAKKKELQEFERRQAKPVKVETYHGAEEERSGPSPMVWAGGIAGALALVGGGAYFFLKPASSPVNPIPPPPTPVVVITPPPHTPDVSTPPPVVRPKQFVFAQGFTPPNAQVRLNGQPVKLGYQGSKVVVPLTGAGAADSLTVELAGWDSKTIPITPDATESTRVELNRQHGEVKVVLEGSRCDYTTAVFLGIAGLSGEQSNVKMEGSELALDFSKGMSEISLPTGLYQITLLGPGGSADTKIQSYIMPQRRFPVTTSTNPLHLPPSFAGRYHCEFNDQTDPTTTIFVQRTIVIDPGLTTGHMDDIYPGLHTKLSGTQVSDLYIDSKGILHGRIRFSTRRADDGMSYDEQFELSYADGKYNMVGGGWEVDPENPVVAKEIREATNKAPNYVPHTARPQPRIVQKD